MKVIIWTKKLNQKLTEVDSQNRSKWNTKIVERLTQMGVEESHSKNERNGNTRLIRK